MVCNCALIAVQKMIATLPHFLSPYLLNIILVVCVQCANCDFETFSCTF